MAFLDKFFIFLDDLPKCPPPSNLVKKEQKSGSSDEPGQTNLKKVPKWLDLVEPSVEGKMEKMAKFWSFFWGKRPVYEYKFDFCFAKTLL